MDNKVKWTGLGIESTVVDVWKLESSQIKQEYQIWVSLPADYNKDTQPHPVLYLLDADATFGLARDIVGLLSLGGEIQKIILVGIAYGEGGRSVVAKTLQGLYTHPGPVENLGRLASGWWRWPFPGFYAG